MDRELSSAELRSIFAESIVPFLSTQGGMIQRSPTLIIVAAQPGAGKTRAVRQAARQHAGAVAVVGDDFRAFHPDYSDLMEHSPLDMPDRTAAASGFWVGASLEHLRRTRQSVVLETTMRQPLVVKKTMQEFSQAGYRVELRVVAVPQALSRLGTIRRYVEQVKEDGAGRWTPSVMHDEAFKRLAQGSQMLATSGLVDRILILERSGQVLLDQEGDSIHAGASDLETQEVIEAAQRLDTVGVAQATEWLNTLRSDAAYAGIGKIQDDDIRRTFEALFDDAPTVATQAYPGDPARRRQALGDIAREMRLLGESTP